MANDTLVSEQALMPKAPDDLFSKLSEGYSYAGLFSNFAGSVLDYGQTRLGKRLVKVQASALQLQAKQRLNQLKEQFIAGVGSTLWSAARRGVSVSSGTVQANLMRSSESLGKDIQTMTQNALRQSDALKTQAKIASTEARYGLWSQGLNTMSSLFATGAK